MAHTTRDKKKLLDRVRRIKGQVSAIEKALDGDQECSKVLQTIAACRGAINGLMAEVMEGHSSMFSCPNIAGAGRHHNFSKLLEIKGYPSAPHPGQQHPREAKRRVKPRAGLSLLADAFFVEGELTSNDYHLTAQ